jgi:AcrR family transcriptional regulator
MDQRVQNGLVTRQRILERSVHLASLEGLSGLTIGRLASDLGLSKGGVFAHFGSKEELQLATLEAAAAVFARAVLEPVDPEQPALLQLRQLCAAWLSYLDAGAFEGGCFFAAAAAELDGRPGALRDRFQAMIHAWLRGLEQLAKDAMRERHLQAKLDVEQLSFELYSLVLGANWSRQLFNNQIAIARARAVVQRRLFELATERGRVLLQQADAKDKAQRSRVKRGANTSDSTR